MAGEHDQDLGHRGRGPRHAAGLQHRAAALRHWILAVSLACAAALPLFEQLVPSWHVALPWRSSAGSPTPAVTQPRQPVPRVSIAVEPSGPSVVTSPSAVWSHPRTATEFVIAAWAAGSSISVAILLIGAARLSRIASRSRRLTSGFWVAIADEIRRAYGLRRRVVVFQTSEKQLLVTWGVLSPKVIVPKSAAAWSEDRIRLVLAHELAHARRADWIVQLGAEVLRAVYWFNPLIWVAGARLRQESEKACDDVVLSRGVDGSAYAAHLVEIARHLGQRRISLPAPAVARTSSLERRVKAMLDTQQNRHPVSRTTGILTLVALLAITIPLAGLAARQSVFFTVSGAITDPTGAALPGVRVVLTNAQTSAKYEIQSDRTGRYELVGLAAGDYLLDTTLLGFAPTKTPISITGQNVRLDLTLALGTIQETISVVGGPGDSRAAIDVTLDPNVARLLEEKRFKRAAARCPDPGPGGAGTGIGGNIRVPMKVTDVRPRYPDSLRGTGIAGAVVLRGRIATDGIVEDLTVVSATHPDFVTAATDAVGKWQFDPTLLNCVPMDVDMTVTVNFSYQP